MEKIEQKKLAIDVHSDQAELFAARYQEIEEDKYRNCFVYSRKRLNQYLDFYLPENGEGLDLLDVGCGTGYHLSRYRDRGFKIVGVDGSDEMLNKARQGNPDIDFHRCDVDNIPFDSNKFDAVLCVEVLRYLPDISPCIKEIMRLLKPGGIALVTAAPPLQADLYPLVNKVVTSIGVKGLTNLKQFFHSTRTLNHVFDDEGFSDVRIHGVYGGPVSWMNRIARSFTPSVLKAWELIDNKTADAPFLRHFSNMFLVYAKK